MILADGARAAPGQALAIGFGVMAAAALLVSLPGMFAAIRIQRVRGRPSSPGAAWLGGVGASTLGFAAVMIFGLTRMPAGSLRKLPENVRTVRDTTPVELPPLVERIAGGRERVKAQQEITKGVVDSSAFIWWSLIIGTMIGCMMMGTFFGSATWAATMLGGRVVLGRWPFKPPPEPLSE